MPAGSIFDVIGLLPSPEEMNAFISDKHADKRERLVHALLADNFNYALNWMTFWNDALRNDYRGTGYIDGGRKQITSWLYAALATNMSYDHFVAQLVNPDTRFRRLQQGNCLARSGQCQPDAADADGAEHFAGLHGREPQMRFMPRQLHQ